MQDEPPSLGVAVEAELRGQRERAEVERRHAPAAERNKEPILDVLRQLLGHLPSGSVLEVASGSGQHAAHFATNLPKLFWQPTEFDTASHGSIVAWTLDVPNVRPPLFLDAAAPFSDWRGVHPGAYCAVFAANVTHISPWEVTLGLVAGAAQALAPGGVLVLYGPFNVDGRPTTESNADFDRSLRSQNPAWGYRDMADVRAAARAAGLEPEPAIPMPANNFILVFRKP